MGKASDDGASLRAAVTRILRPAVLRGEELHRAISAILSTYASPQATENAEHKLHDVVIEIPNQLPQRKFAIYFTYNQCPSKCQLMKIRFIGFLLLMSSAASAYGVQLIGRILTPGLERVWKHKVRNKIWIPDQVAIRGSPHSPMCKTCNPMPKSAAHLSCAFASEIWQLLSLVTPSIAAADLTENSVML